MSGAIPPLPQYAFMAGCLVKAQGQLYLCLYIYLYLIKFFIKNKTLYQPKTKYIDIPSRLHVFA
jgi:hypothetical protein